jgi:ABC-2 type transport system permease protein
MSKSPLSDVGKRRVNRAQRLYWSVRRELWEHRSLYLAPLAVAAISLVGVLIHSLSLSEFLNKVATKPPHEERSLLSASYSAVAVAVMLATVLTACVYCLDALFGERRDRTILFWKSLPLSDATAVVAKALVPMLILPIVGFAIIISTQIVVLLTSSVIAFASGHNVVTYWSKLPIIQMIYGVFYFLFALAFWFAPIYAWFLAVSAWAKRAPLVWAVAPALALVAIQQLLVPNLGFVEFLRARTLGVFESAFTRSNQNVVPDPAKFFSDPALWLGLVAASAFLIVAIKLRRRRDSL